MDVLSLALGVAAGGVLGYLPARLRRPAPAASPAPAAAAPQPEPVVVIVERAAEAIPQVGPEPEPPITTTPEALELLKERDRRLTADAKLRLVRD